MKRLMVCAGALVLAAAGQTALAADIPPAIPVKAPAVVPAYNWYGFFIGGHAGYGFGRDAVTFPGATGVYVADLGTNIPSSAASRPGGFIGGIQWGTNYQFDRWVLGTLSDFSWTDIHRTETIALGTRSNFADQSLKWFGTTRVRVGYAVQDNVLVYASGGLASGTTAVNVSNNMIAVACTIGGACPNGGQRNSRWGWAAGGGIEVGSGPWSFAVEYLHYDLGSVTFNYTDAILASTLTSSTRFSGDIVRGALSYRFNWTPLGLIFGGR